MGLRRSPLRGCCLPRAVRLPNTGWPMALAVGDWDDRLDPRWSVPHPSIRIEGRGTQAHGHIGHARLSVTGVTGLVCGVAAFL